MSRYLSLSGCAVVAIALLAACTSATLAPEGLSAADATSIPSASPTALASDTPAPTVTIPQPKPTATQAPRICSPLLDAPLAQIDGLVSNPYHPPPLGSDNPHAGVDLAVRLPETQMAVAGQTVQAALAGMVAMITRDRFPFGNAILIETPLEVQPANWWQPAGIPSPADGPLPRTSLTCPDGPTAVFADPGRRSIYTLYAHMQEPAAFQRGDTVTCGQAIGRVGSTGNAMNPHLHFETRVGPSGLRLASMAHYDSSATEEEMRSYCLWTVSGQFLLVDPLKVLRLTP